MLTDYFSCYKHNNKSTPFQEEKKSRKLTDLKYENVSMSSLEIFWLYLVNVM